MPFFLAARDDPPLKSDFKPALKVLSRKPAPKVIQKIDPVTGLAQMSIEDDEEEEEKKDQPSPEELRYRAQKEREEKQKRYDEVRARIMGTGSGASSPGTTTPPAEDSRGGSRGRGRGRGKQSFDNQRPLSRSGSNQLFDPSYTPRTRTRQYRLRRLFPRYICQDLVCSKDQTRFSRNIRVQYPRKPIPVNRSPFYALRSIK